MLEHAGPVAAGGRINRMPNGIEYALYVTIAVVIAVILLRRFRVNLRSGE